MMTIMVTGGAGFIGSHIVEEYLKRGYKVVVVDDLSSGKIENLRNVMDDKNFYFYNLNIQDKEALEKIFIEHKPNVINHHAAQKSIPHSIEDPISDIQTNGVGLLNLIMLTKKYPIKNFIYISSGGALSKEIIEDEKSKEIDWPQQKSPYAITKFSGENYIKIYSSLFGYQYTILRYANIYGPRQIADGECGVIPIFVNNIMENKKSILMTYDDMPNGCTRDYVYIDDIVDINMRVTEKSINDVINIGSGEEIAILDIYKMVEKVFGSNIGINIIGPREGDIKRSVLDYTYAESKTGWRPKVKLDEGLQKLHSYIINN